MDIEAPFPRPIGQSWLDQVFASDTARRGGVVRRKVSDVEREVGVAALELEVRRRGYHLLRSGGTFIVICRQDPVLVIC
ncbi:N-(5'-phosphoribosyl)anthranilate isomerase [Histidinibacterium lentulum]|uniref:N-(5'-phosphoribosyl)anthranilate isomerase n=1 Tax=Histidinibacterium lentulum TaxID=2480588 RepID=A0A3N2QTZ2_9RHOB|nr:N-(5'-phosphoribosyl)anthranilate isomerase [Histidinibacterium lentulum]ROT98599.1 N-(5'-phosphoribosyl)anthranilate isomerase [Histidinibacterium lentulum]